MEAGPKRCQPHLRAPSRLLVGVDQGQRPVQHLVQHFRGSVPANRAWLSFQSRFRIWSARMPPVTPSPDGMATSRASYPGKKETHTGLKRVGLSLVFALLALTPARAAAQPGFVRPSFFAPADSSLHAN